MRPGPKLNQHEIKELLRDQKAVLVTLTTAADPVLLFPDGDWQLLFTSASTWIWEVTVAHPCDVDMEELAFTIAVSEAVLDSCADIDPGARPLQVGKGEVH